MLSAEFKFVKSYLKWWKTWKCGGQCAEKATDSFSPQNWNGADGTSCPDISSHLVGHTRSRMYMLCCLPGKGAHGHRAPVGLGAGRTLRGTLAMQKPLRTLAQHSEGQVPSVPPDMPWQGMSPPQPLLQWDPAAWSKSLQAKIWVLISEKYSLSGLIYTTVTHLAVLLLSSISTYEQINIQKYCHKGHKFNNNQSIFSIFFCYIRKMEKSLHISVPLLNFHSKDAAKVNKTQNVYLISHIKLQIMYA